MNLDRYYHRETTRHDVSFKELKSRKKLDRIVRARHAAWARAYHMGIPYAEIARQAGRDHTTIMSGVKRHRERAGL